MMLRHMGCIDCRRLTSGDCGKHGPLIITTAAVPWTTATGGYVPTPEQREIAELRAENRRLREQLAALPPAHGWQPQEQDKETKKEI